MGGRQLKPAQSLKLGAAAQTLPVIVGYGAHLIATPFIILSLGLTNFGLWALTGAIAQYAALLDLGVSRAITRFVAVYHTTGDEGRERAVVGGSVMIIVALGSTLLAIALLIPAQLGGFIGVHDINLSRVLFCSSVVVFVTGVLATMFKGASIGRGRMVAGNIGLSLQRASVAIGGVVALLVKPTLSYFALGSAVGGAIGLAIVLLAVLVDEREIKIGLPKTSVMADLISFGMKGQAASVAEIVLLQSGKILAGIIVSPAAAGIFELGSRLALGCRAFGTSTSSIVTAHMARGFAVNGPAEIQKDYARLVQRNATVSIFPMLFLMATSFSIVPAWLGTKPQDVVSVLIALSVAYSVNVAVGIPIAATYALNRLGVVVVIAIGGSILVLALAVPLAYIAGLFGILIGLVLAIVISSLTGVVAIHRTLRIPLRDFFYPVIGPFLVGCVSVALSMPIGICILPADRGSAIIPFLASAAIYSSVYIALSWKLSYLPNFNLPLSWRARGSAS
jgi:O-antigen/teichoic acid export membrane protein